MYNHAYKDLIANLRVSRADVDFFATFPFVRRYMDSSSPNQPVPFVTRYDKGDSSDLFFNKTINSNDTVPRVLAFMRKLGSFQSLPTDNYGKDVSQGLGEPHFVVFCQLERGLNGFIDTAHGGILAALFDEALAICVESYRVLVPEERESLLTAGLEVRYRSPVSTPGVVVIKSG